MLLSAVKQLKKQRKLQKEGVPPPWMGLQHASKEVQQWFLEAEWKEINGILDTKAAYEVLRKDLPECTPRVPWSTTRSPCAT